jgi:HAD superfamily hydrolase (TIGR01509 family)
MIGNPISDALSVSGHANISAVLRAIIFDFDGVLADTEPLHFEAFSDVLAPLGISLSRDEYFSKYLGLNDEALLRAIFAEQRRALTDESLRRLRAAKDAAYEARIERGMNLLPGVADFIRAAGARWRLAICSGARRAEIQTILRRAGLAFDMDLVVSADEVPISKPDPTGYLRTLELLQMRHSDLHAGECLAVEDSILGLRAAKAAGLKTLAMLGGPNHPTAAIRSACQPWADKASESLEGLGVETVDSWFRDSTIPDRRRD